MKRLNKSGQMGTLGTLVIALLGIGIILGVGFIVIEEFKGTMDNTVGTVINETVTIDSTPVFLKHNWTTAGDYCYNSFAVTKVISGNSTGGTIGVLNYTADSITGTIRNITLNSYGLQWNVSYTYKYGDEGCGAVNKTIEATQKIPGWLSIIVILVIVGILLAIVFKVVIPATSGGGKSGGTVAEI